MNHSDKIKTLEEIIGIAEKARRSGKCIVTTNGSFDIFHAGHVELLKKAKEKGDILIVGLNSDQSVRGYKKKPGRPIVPEKFRAETVASVMYVDYVFLFNDLIPNEWLLKIRPNVHANSAEYGKDCVESEAIRKYGGKLFLIPRKNIPLSTSLIEKKIRKEENVKC